MRFLPLHILALLVVLALGAAASLAQGSIPPVFLDKAYETPDLTQNDLPEVGSSYCGPVSASNAIVWLAEHGFPALQDGLSQVDLALELGGSAYMGTTRADGRVGGTGGRRMTEGLDRYVQHSGYTLRRLEYMGFQGTVASQYVRGEAGAGPELDWLLESVHGYTGVMLHIGWYDYDPWLGTYTRNGGHWVTLVGYETKPVASTIEAVSTEVVPHLVIHDPSGRSRNAYGEFYNERIRLVPIESGIRTNGAKYEAPSDEMAGYHRIEGDLMIRTSKGNVAVLDGAVVFEVTLQKFDAKSLAAKEVHGADRLVAPPRNLPRDGDPIGTRVR